MYRGGAITNFSQRVGPEKVLLQLLSLDVSHWKSTDKYSVEGKIEHVVHRVVRLVYLISTCYQNFKSSSTRLHQNIFLRCASLLKWEWQTIRRRNGFVRLCWSQYNNKIKPWTSLTSKEWSNWDLEHPPRENHHEFWILKAPSSYPSNIGILDLERHPYQCTLCGMRNTRVTRTDLQNNQEAATSSHQPTRDPDTILNITIYLEPTYCTVSNSLSNWYLSHPFFSHSRLNLSTAIQYALIGVYDKLSNPLNKDTTNSVYITRNVCVVSSCFVLLADSFTLVKIDHQYPDEWNN